MPDPIAILTLCVAGLAGLAMLIAGGLAGWRDWLDLERRRLGGAAADRAAPAGTRIELANLRERIRKLEAIAAGIDL